MHQDLSISLVMAAYNSEKYLTELLASVLAQTRKPDEFIICNDGSSDKTREILEAFACTAPFPVKVLTHEQNQGLSKALNTALSASTCDICIITDHDDVLFSNRIQAIEQVFLREPKTGIVFSDAEIVNAELTPTNLTLSQFHTSWEKASLLRKEGFPVFINRNLIYGTTMGFRRSYLPLILPIHCHYFGNRDYDGFYTWDSWVAILISYVSNTHFIDSPLLLYRQHSQSYSGEIRPISSFERMRRKIVNCLNFFLLSAENKLELQKHYTQKKILRLQQLQEIYDRVTKTNDMLKSNPRYLKLLTRKIKHFETLTRLPSNRAVRWIIIAKELLTYRFQYYSFTRSDIFVDLFLETNP